MYHSLIFEKSGGVAFIRLNRPEVYNAFNEELKKELLSALKEAEKDREVRAIVLTGEGKAFCSGQDLKEITANPNLNIGHAVRNQYNPIIYAMRTMAKPIIARVNGIAAGAGCSLALACDVIIASEEASFTEAFINIGLVPDSGSSYFLPRMVGTLKAFELATTGRKFSGKEAFDLGVINKVVPLATLDDAVNEMANFYAQAPTKAIGLIKKMLNKSFHCDLDAMLEYEAQCQKIAAATNDSKEGVQAFIEKRKAVFKGE
jgi:2-(1,2-epoxy-1,2-dihydrophenyl)acetyl-CoA isomerase